MNVYGGVKTPYFQTQFVVAEALPRLSGSATKLMTFLAASAHRHNAVELELSQSVIKEKAGIADRKTILKAARELESEGFISLRRTPSGVFAYVLVDAATGEPLPKPKRYSGVLRYRKGEPKTENPAEVAAMARPADSKATSTPPSTGPKQSAVRIVPAKADPTPAVFCKTHPNAITWHLPDGTPRCEGCHPQPQANSPSIRQPTGKELFD